MASKANYWT